MAAGRSLLLVAIVVCVLAATAPAARADAQASTNFVTMVSEPGDWVGGGVDRLINAPEALSFYGGAEWVSVMIEANGDRFSLEFMAPSGKDLTVGEYPGAERAGFQVKNAPGLNVSIQGGCNKSYGRFIVKDIHFSPLGNVERFLALYEQHCESLEEPALFGEVSFGEPPPSAPEVVQPAAIEWPRTAVAASGADVPVTVTAGESGAKIESVTLAGADPHDFAVVSDGCEGAALAARQACQLVLATKPTVAGPRAAELVITDASGARSTVPLSVNPTPPPPPPASSNYVTMVSEPEDYVGIGIDRVFNEPEAVSLTGDGNHVEVSVEARGGDRFKLEFAAPAGTNFEVGEYVDAERYPFGPKDQPGIMIDGDGRGCNQDYGRFVVKDVQINASDEVERFVALYEQHCEQPGAPALFGEVSYGERAPATPEVVQPSAIEWPQTAVGAGSVGVPVTVTANESGAQVESVRLAGGDARDFAVTSDTCEGTPLAPRQTCQVVLVTKPIDKGPLDAELVVTDKSGASSTVALNVNPNPPPPPRPSTNYVTMVSEEGDWIGGGVDRLFNEPGAVSVSGSGGVIDVTAEGKGAEFSFRFAAPSGKNLEIGEYVGAERYPLEAERSPGLDISGDGRGCNTSHGRFVVKDLHFDALGKVDRFLALYEQDCEGKGAPALFGEISFGEPAGSAPELVQPGAIEWPPTGVGAKGAEVPVTVTAGESGARIESVSITGADARDFKVAKDECTRVALAARHACQVVVVTKPAEAGPLSAELALTDQSGATSTVPLSVNPNPPQPPPVSGNYATMVSEAGDYIGGGADRLFDGEAVSAAGGGAHVDVSAQAEGEHFSFEFAAPAGKNLEVGEYAGAERYPFETEASPGLSVSGAARGCNTDYGRFVVKDIHFSASGSLERFLALYEQHCETAAGPALFGEVSFGEPAGAAPELVQPAAIEWPPTASGASATDVPVTVTAGESGAQLESISLAGKDPDDFAVVSNGCQGKALAAGQDCQIVLVAKPTEGGPHAAELVLTDKTGTTSAVELSVNAKPPPAEPPPPVETATPPVNQTPAVEAEPSPVGQAPTVETEPGPVGQAPTVKAQPPSVVGETSATLNATIQPNGGEVTECKVEYGTTASYGAAAPCSMVSGSPGAPVAVSASLHNLSEGMSYHYSVVATNRFGADRTSDQAFTTACLAPPSTMTGSRVSKLLKHRGMYVTFTATTPGHLTVNWYSTNPNIDRRVIVAIGGHTFKRAGESKIWMSLTSAGARLLRHQRRPNLTAIGVFERKDGKHAVKKFYPRA